MQCAWDAGLSLSRGIAASLIVPISGKDSTRSRRVYALPSPNDQRRLDRGLNAALLARFDQDGCGRAAGVGMDEANALGFERPGLQLDDQLSRAQRREDYCDFAVIGDEARGGGYEIAESRVGFRPRDSAPGTGTYAAAVRGAIGRVRDHVIERGRRDIRDRAGAQVGFNTPQVIEMIECGIASGKLGEPGLQFECNYLAEGSRVSERRRHYAAAGA